jgi:hypothetical protein
MACLPLQLAGHAVTVGSLNQKAVVVEFGPFAGFSSKCIVAGMKDHNDTGDSPPPIEFVAFDTFQNAGNFKNIVQRAPWLQQEYPNMSGEDTDFLPLWTDTVQDIYPQAHGVAGYITEDTVNHGILGNKQVALLSIDSAKDASQLLSQTRGIQPLKAGTILILMDFEFVSSQIKQIYGCLREQYLMPVYISWMMEHWAFVVTQDVTLSNAALADCYGAIADAPDTYLPRVQERVRQDLLLLSALSEDNELIDSMKEIRQGLEGKLLDNIGGFRRGEWKQLAKLYQGD